MTNFDYVLLAVVLVSAVLGAMRGFLRECIALAAWIFGIWFAWLHHDLIDPYLGGALAQEPIRTWTARAIALFGILLLGTAVGALANHFIRSSIFSGFDRLIGFVFGALRGLLILAVLGMLGLQLHLNGEKWWKTSALMPYVESMSGALRSMTGDTLPLPQLKGT